VAFIHPSICSHISPNFRSRSCV